MKTTKNIIQGLHITYLHYDNCRNHYFNEWCVKYSSKFGMSLRKMVTHDGLYNWYCDQWILHVEKPFVQKYGEELKSEDLEITSALQSLFFEFTEAVENYYPKPLLKMIKDENTPKRHLTV